jgi:ABC-2 family transporter protein
MSTSAEVGGRRSEVGQGRAGAIFWRIVWKEYRALRAFWLAMAVLAVLIQLLIAKYPPGNNYAPQIFAMALMFPALYATACGATMFAAEKDDGTYEFLRGLPVTANRLLFTKLAYAVASTLLLVALLWFVAAVLSTGYTLEGGSQRQLWGIWGLAAIEGLVWGILFSLLLDRPLQAAIIAIAAASLCIHVAAWSVIQPGDHLTDIHLYLTAIPYRVIIAAIVLFADVWLAGRLWSALGSAALGFLRRGGRRSVAKAPTESQSKLAQSRAAVIGRLIWQTSRQSRVSMIIIGLVGGVAALTSFQNVLRLIPAFDDRGIPEHIRTMLFIVASASLMGSCVFLADQERHKLRFLTEQGIRPRSVWLVRQLTWLMAVAIWAAVVHGLWFMLDGGPRFLSAGREYSLGGNYGESMRWQFVSAFLNLPSIATSLGLTFTAFACGQLASMLLRSGIMAGVLGLVLSAFVCGWALLMQALEVSWWWSVAPIPLVLLWATWLRTPDWALERNSWRGWLRVGAAVCGPAGAILVAVPMYRVHQIPLVSPGFSPDEFARSLAPTVEQQKTADLYRRAGELLPKTRWTTDEHNSRPPDAEELTYLRENAESLTIALDANKRPDCSFYGTALDSSFWDNSSALATLIGISARQLEAEGKLDEAWDRHLAVLRFYQYLGTRGWDVRTTIGYDQFPLWASQPGQSRARIVSAIKQLQEFERKLPSPATSVEFDYLHVRRWLEEPRTLMAQMGKDQRLFLHIGLAALMPWERERAQRLLDFGTAIEISRLDFISRALLEGDSVLDAIPDRSWGNWTEKLVRTDSARWLRSTYLLSAFWIGEEASGRLLEFARSETRRRATHLLMAIEAWKVDHHGGLPNDPKELVGVYLDKLPLDPYTGMSFRYVREALSPPPKFVFDQNSVPRKPFIWSPGDKVELPLFRDENGRLKASEPVSQVSIYDMTSGWSKSHTPSSDFEIWLSGWYFEIP